MDGSNAPSLMVKLPREILDRVERVTEYHRSTKLTPAGVRANPTVLDPATKPSPYRRFDGLPSVQMPTRLLDAPTPAVSLLADGLGAVAAAELHPPQDLRTLASWLYLADGLVAKTPSPTGVNWQRSCPSAGGLYPCELYVAAFGIDGLPPGLYHYHPLDFTLTKLRDGVETLAALKRGRPDLNFLKSVPAAMLVSTIYWRSAWRYRQRGYRMALLDAGHLVQNLVAVANGLGFATNARLQVSDKTMREVIGISPRADFGIVECVQAMVVWADHATTPLPDPPADYASPRGGLLRIKREPLSPSHVPYGSILATHEDCTAPGFALRDIRPPLTELSPVPLEQLAPAPVEAAPDAAASIRQLLVSRRSTRQFAHTPITLARFVAINRLAFRGGSLFPMMPDGSHIALVRPYWIAHRVDGMESGVWYYDPIGDRLHHATANNAGATAPDAGPAAAHLCCEQKIAGDASAVCFLVADLKTLLASAGPDAYRLAHLEAGVAGQRIYLAAEAMELGCCGLGAFYDDDIRSFLGLGESGWEPVYALAVGYAAGR